VNAFYIAKNNLFLKK